VDTRTAVDLILAATAIGAIFGAYTLGGRTKDRTTINGLQRALTGSLPQVPGLAIGSVVLSASPGLSVGGDIVDIFALDSRFVLLLVADVSGKGVEAAAYTAFVKYTIRTLALESDGDPAVVVAKFNALYARTVADRETFVVLILGIIDSQTGDVRYASAGHEPAYLRRCDGRVTMLAPTGPIVGAAPYSAYRSDVVTLERGDALIWTTDGVTESRDRKRRLLGPDGLANWIAGAPHDVRAIADWLVTSLRARSAGSGTDDVAVLAVAYEGAQPEIPRRVPAAHRFGDTAQPAPQRDRRRLRG
jgi:sigma-B regulation protein RsbU (phosphoserine phosphatase)